MAMIVWKGKGLLFLLLPIPMFFVAAILLGILGLDASSGELTVGTILLLSSIPCWFIGEKINKTKMLLDGNGELVAIKNQHSIFWIPVQYFSIVYVVLAVLLFLLLQIKK